MESQGGERLTTEQVLEALRARNLFSKVPQEKQREFAEIVRDEVEKLKAIEEARAFSKKHLAPTEQEGITVRNKIIKHLKKIPDSICALQTKRADRKKSMRAMAKHWEQCQEIMVSNSEYFPLSLVREFKILREKIQLALASDSPDYCSVLTALEYLQSRLPFLGRVKKRPLRNRRRETQKDYTCEKKRLRDALDLKISKFLEKECRLTNPESEFLVGQIGNVFGLWCIAVHEKNADGYRKGSEAIRIRRRRVREIRPSKRASKD